MKKYIHLYSFVSFLVLFSFSSTLFSQTQITGNLSTYIDSFISLLPNSGGDDYELPSSGNLIVWENVINGIIEGNYSYANTAADEIGYRLVSYTDNSVSPNKKYYVLEKKSTSNNYWGMFVFNPNATRTKIFIQSPHPKYDSNTGKQGFYIFKNLNCRAFFMTGTHRCNSSTPSPCSGTSQVCTGSDDPYKISDQAHNTSGTLQRTTEVLNSSISNLIVIQPHGFSQDVDDPDVIMSNGTRNTPAPDYIAELKNNLLSVDSDLTFKITHLDLSWSKLIATTNTQGRLINESADPCSQSASTTSGRFIHVEQAYSLRDTEASRKKLSDAIGLTFENDGLNITAPNGKEILTSGTTHNITWTSAGLISNVKLDYSIDNGLTWVPIISSTPNNNTYSWTVPSIGSWRTKIRILDADYSSIGDTSNSVFKINHSVYPTTGLTTFVDPASAFGPRNLNGVYDFHRGMDFPGTINTPIHPANPGVIVRQEDETITAGTGLQRFGSWVLIKIDSTEGEPNHNAYLHLNGFHKFSVGDTVTTSDTIGFMGNSGYEINTVHLHFELYKGLYGTAIDKNKAKNPIESITTNDSNNFTVNFISRNDSSAVEVSTPDTDLDFDEITIYGSLLSRTIGFNARTGIDPNNNDNATYNSVLIDPDPFVKDSTYKRIRFWTKDSEIGTINSVNLTDISGNSITVSQSSFGERYAVASGNWNDAIWAYTSDGSAGSASVPVYLNDIRLNSNVTVNINIPSAECHSVSFTASSSKMIFSSNSILTVYGDFSLASRTHNAFTSWASGSKLRFSGNDSLQTIKNLYKDASTFSSSFMELVIDKTSGRVTVEDSVRFNIGSDLEINNGVFELAYRADIEGRNLNGSSSTTPTITVGSGGIFEMVGSLSHIRTGTTSTNPIGKMTVYGNAILRSNSTNGLAFGDIDVKSGGVLTFDSFSSGSANKIKTGSVKIENGGLVIVNSIIAFWHSSSSIDLATNGVFSINSNPDDIDNCFPLAFTNNGTIEYSFEGDQSIRAMEYSSLFISGAGSKTLSENINVNEYLKISGGSLITNANVVSLGESAEINEGAGTTLVGNVSTTRQLQQSVVNNFGGIGIEINSLNSSPGLTAVTRNTGTFATANSSVGIKRIFDIVPQNNSGLNASLTFKYDESELNTLNENELKLFKSVDNGINWDLVGGVVNTTNNEILLTGINSFSQWTAASSETPLPVNEVSFDAYSNNGDVNLSWNTQTELNSYSFEVERQDIKKKQSELWLTVGQVAAAGSSFSTKSYIFCDEGVKSGNYYYRLKMIDHSGSYKYSKTIELAVAPPNSYKLFQNYPNPFNPTTTISFTIPIDGFVRIDIYDITGALVRELVNGYYTADFYSISFNASGLSSGSYICRIKAENFTDSKKIILIK